LELVRGIAERGNSTEEKKCARGFEVREKEGEEEERRKERSLGRDARRERNLGSPVLVREKVDDSSTGRLSLSRAGNNLVLDDKEVIERGTRRVRTRRFGIGVFACSRARALERVRIQIWRKKWSVERACAVGKRGKVLPSRKHSATLSATVPLPPKSRVHWQHCFLVVYK